MWRRLSFRRTTHSFPKDPVPRAPRPKGVVRCTVALLDDNSFTCDVDKHENGDVLLEEVYDHLNLLERDYFGLSYKDEGITKWVDPAKPLKKQFKGCHKLALEFRVKFYVTDPSRLQEELTRYLFYCQIKKDLFHGRIPYFPESAAVLGSYILQAELGNYDPQKHPPGYVSEFRFILGQTEELEERMARLHQSLRGRTTAETEFQFLSYARQLEFYGVELFHAKDHHGVDLELGITANGIAVFKKEIALTTFSWLNIQRITYKKKKFYIELRPEHGQDLQNVVGFHMDRDDGCKQLWKNCIEYHAFFRLPAVKEPPRKFFKKKFRYSGRTERQVIEENREEARRRAMSFRVKRTPSKRYTRRETSGATVRRATSDLSSKYTVRPFVQKRHRPFSDEVDDDEDYSYGVSMLSDPDDMTGQFSLVSIEDPSPLHLSSTLGPTEYYDQTIADGERKGVDMDALASEGLLLIRMKSDENKKFGFHVSNGAPVLVTKVSPDSPAAICNPRLEEGDRVLHINGKPVAEKTHDQVIRMIQASSELVIVVEPKDLMRVNPIVVRKEPLEVSDPGHLLRESLTFLKETLNDGKALLHFDRLYRRKPGMAAIASKLPQNLHKNRYRDISAYDVTRVELKEGPDYINANFVDCEIYTTGQIIGYIAAQGPMQHTCIDFWQMVWEQESTLIVMLTNVMEDGKVRCCCYWPDAISSQEYGKYEVYTVSEHKDRISISRVFRLRNNMTGEQRRVEHMQYIDWPDHGIPGSQVDFLRFVREVKSLRKNLQGPVIVHCSAGIGRTGMLMLMETALCKMEVLEPIYPLEVVRSMRDQRGMLVQTPIQYQFVCESILKAYEEDYLEIELPVRSPITYS